MPEVGFHFLAHLDTVAGVLQRAVWEDIGLLQVALHHILVVFKAAGAHDDAVFRTNVQKLAFLFDLHALDHLGLRILDQVLGRGFIPQVDLVPPGVDIILQQVIVRAVKAASADTVIKHMACAGQFGILALAAPGFAGTAVVIKIVGIRAQVNQPFTHFFNLIGISFDHGVRGGVEEAAQTLVIDDGVFLALEALQPLARYFRIAAFKTFFALFGEQDTGALVGSHDGGVGTCSAVAHDDHVILSVPLGIGSFCFSLLERQAGSGQADRAGCYRRTFEKFSAGNVHDSSSFVDDELVFIDTAVHCPAADASPMASVTAFLIALEVIVAPDFPSTSTLWASMIAGITFCRATSPRPSVSWCLVTRMSTIASSLNSISK